MTLSTLVSGAIIASRYEILGPLGEGGMGIVYKAYDRELEENVALKVLRGDLGGDPEMARRFRSEIKLARKVRHRNVCAIHEFGQAGSMLFIAMELIDGLDLKHVLRQQGPMPPRQAYALAAQVADGLQAIHDEGIIHRDLKTTNIMLDKRGLVRLMDFGIAKQWQAEDGAGVTGTGQIVGTPEYMSPEQGRGHKLDFRSDVYSLGIVVFELFTGRLPFRGDTPVAVILKHLQDPPPLDDAANTGLPGELVPILRKALAKDPADRFPKARLMAQALRQAGGGVPMPTATLGLVSPTRSRRRVDILALTAAALLVAGAFVYRLSSSRPLPTSPVASQAVVPLQSVPTTLATPGTLPPAVPETPSPVAEAGNGEAQRLLARARSEQRATLHIRAAEAALEHGDASEASTQAEAARAAAPFDSRLAALSSRILDLQQQKQREAAARTNDLLDRAEKALESLNSRAAAPTASEPPAPARSFVSGKTQAQSAETRTADAAPPGFDPGSGITVSRSTQPAALPGLIAFEVEPQAVKPGDKYTVKIVFVNGGPAPIEIRTMNVTTLTNGGRSGGPVSPLTRLVAPRERAVLLSPQGAWRDELKSWSMQATVYTAQGDSYTNEVTWK